MSKVRSRNEKKFSLVKVIFQSVCGHPIRCWSKRFLLLTVSQIGEQTGLVYCHQHSCGRRTAGVNDRAEAVGVQRGEEGTSTEPCGTPVVRGQG